MKVATEYLLYDENCPLCIWYTRAFVKYGIISPEARLSYQIAEENQDIVFDRDRARTEIAFVSEGSEPSYGVDSMLKVIGNKWNIIGYIGRILPIYWLLQLLYRFISFNRKIIAPTTCQMECSCTPKFSLFWRITFIGFCGWITYYFVGNYFNVELTGYLKSDHFSFEFILFVGQLIFQTLVFKLLKQKDLFTYLGHVALISLMGALLLGGFELILVAFRVFNIEEGFIASMGLGVVLTFMFFEHRRRIKLLGLTSWLTFTWVCFRVLIYPLVFNF